MKKVATYLVFLIAFSAAAQNGFYAGYVIQNNGDTLKGKIKDRKFVNSTTSWQKIDFVDQNGKKFKFDPEEIKEYRKAGKSRYVTLTIGVESRKTFLEVIADGAVILYSYNRGTWGGAGTTFLVVTSSTGPKERVEFFLQKRGLPNSLMQWRPSDYKSTAKVFFDSDKELLQKIETGERPATDILEIVKTFNAAKN